MLLKSTQINFNQIDKELEIIFNNLDKLKLKKIDEKKILNLLQKKLRLYFWLKIFLILLIFLILIGLFYYITFLNWNLSAIGRIFLIKILPLWNWKNFYNQKCLIKWNDNTLPRQKSFQLNQDDCAVCENYGKFLKIIKKIN